MRLLDRDAPHPTSRFERIQIRRACGAANVNELARAANE
jgi:hypothetical protein